jgi:hypothetical protein
MGASAARAAGTEGSGSAIVEIVDL